MAATVDQLRRRLGVPAELVDDPTLQACLDVAVEGIGPWAVADAATLFPASMDEWTYQVAVKIYDTGTTGVTSMDAMGEFQMPSPSATQSMIRGAFGAAGPALLQGGLSV